MIRLAAAGIIFSAAVALSFSSGQPRNLPSAYESGLKIWRKPGAVQNGAACSTCHGPDAVELAAYAFDDADIKRRALVHLTDVESDEVVRFVHAVRAKYGFTRLLNPLKDRPFQPGGTPLPGETSQDRDVAFGKELKKRAPLFFAGSFRTIAQAEAAKRQILGLDPFTLRFGIPQERISEDVAHGQEHASIAQWLPEQPPLVPADKIADWYKAEDNYLANPNTASLRGLIALHQRLMGPPLKPGMEILGQAKFRALLILQHRLRTRDPLSGDLEAEVGRPGEPGPPNPIWEIGAFAQVLSKRNAAGLGFTPDLAAKKEVGPGLTAQMRDLELDWFWLGWLFDQGADLTSRDKFSRLGFWLANALWTDGPYPIHSIYAETRRQVVVSNDPAVWAGPPATRRLFWDYPGCRATDIYLAQTPKDPEHRKLYLAFTANAFRMNLLLLLQDIRKTSAVYMKHNSVANVGLLCDFVENADPSSRLATESLKQELLERLAGARELYQ